MKLYYEIKSCFVSALQFSEQLNTHLLCLGVSLAVAQDMRSPIRIEIP